MYSNFHVKNVILKRENVLKLLIQRSVRVYVYSLEYIPIFPTLTPSKSNIEWRGECTPIPNISFPSMNEPLTHTHSTMITSHNTLNDTDLPFHAVYSTGSILFYFISLLRFKFNSFFHSLSLSLFLSWNTTADVAVPTCVTTTTTTKH